MSGYAVIQELTASRWRLDSLGWFGDYAAKWTLTRDSSGEKEYTRLQWRQAEKSSIVTLL